MNSELIKVTKRTLLILGVLLIVGTLLLAFTMVSGLVNLPEKLIAGESTVHSVARIAIIGCLLAAVGTMD
ncbi:MAG: hypothetical protein ACR2QG_06400 [Gammaproteobacteria bacterium]